MKIPCSDCICFALCNASLDRYDGTYKAILVNLMPSCEIIRDYILKSHSHDTFVSLAKSVATLYGLQKGITNVERIF